MTDAEKTEGAWIFLSHSHKDLPKVRLIRNELEKLGHNPLMFFLKCLNDESELDDLIRREITERNWFILCDSPMARDSKWVRDEVEMIKSLDGKVFEVVSLEEGIEKQIDKISKFSKRVTIFLSYARIDSGIAQKINDRLKKEDYRVFYDMDSLKTDGDWSKMGTNTIDMAVQEGFVLLLLSADSLTSQFCRHEFMYALAKNAQSSKSNIIPVVVREPSKIISILPPELAQIQCIDLATGDFDDNMDKLISHLKKRDME